MIGLEGRIHILLLFDLLEISLKLYNTKSTRLLHIKKLIYFNVVYSILLKYKLGSVVAWVWNLKNINIYFSKFYGKVGVISWLLFHLIWKNYVLYWDFDSKSWIVDFFTRFTHEKTPQNNFSRQNFSVENNYFYMM